jgi:Protein of unknown function (DUF2933)
MSSTSTSLVPRTAARPTGANASSWLSSRRVLVLAVVAGIAALASGWYWLGFAAIAPLLFLLPCAAMMAFCMKGMGNGEGQCSGKNSIAQAPDSDSARRQT